MKSFHLNNGIKLMLTGFAAGTALVLSAAFAVVGNLQNKLDESYADFAQLITRAAASEITELYGISDEEKSKSFSKKFLPFIMQNEDIAYIEYKDENNNLIYSSKNDISVSDEDVVINVSTPVIYGDIKGSVTIGMSGNSIRNISESSITAITGGFILLWVIFTLLLFINYIFVSKELKKLYTGVKRISTGQFGYKLQSDNMGELTDAFNDMSSILSKYEEQNIEQLTLERNKLEAVLMSIINGVIVCDNFDNVVMANSSALRILDIDEAAFINTKIQDYTDFHGQRCFLEKIEEFKDTPLNIIEQKPIEFNIEAGKLTVKAMISPMFSKQQDYVGYVIVLLDVTRETEVSKLKNTFISNVSHELRTPVTVLRTYIDTLCHNGNDLDEQTKNEFMQTIDTEAKRLHTMVNDILDFSRLESDSVNLKKEYADIIELIEQNINSIKILADEKNIKIKFEVLGEVPKIPMNIESIDRAVRNLLSNAIKYSKDNKDILVTVKKSNCGRFIETAFKDNGIGMEKEHLEKIFDRFYRIENATHTIKGTGLGLHLVKAAVEKHHHGKITVESKKDEGSIFTIFLPINADECELD